MDIATSTLTSSTGAIVPMRAVSWHACLRKASWKGDVVTGIYRPPGIAEPGSRLEIIDPYTVRFVFPEPDGGAMARLVIMHMANRQFHRELGWGEKSW